MSLFKHIRILPIGTLLSIFYVSAAYKDTNNVKVELVSVWTESGDILILVLKIMIKEQVVRYKGL
jgi:hypothetical protein